MLGWSLSEMMMCWAAAGQDVNGFSLSQNGYEMMLMIVLLFAHPCSEAVSAVQGLLGQSLSQFLGVQPQANPSSVHSRFSTSPVSCSSYQRGCRWRRRRFSSFWSVSNLPLFTMTSRRSLFTSCWIWQRLASFRIFNTCVMRLMWS